MPNISMNEKVIQAVWAIDYLVSIDYLVPSC